MTLLKDNNRYRIVSDDYTKEVEVGISGGDIGTLFKAIEGERVTFFGWRALTPKCISHVEKNWKVVRQVSKIKSINRYFKHINSKGGM